MSWAIEHTLRGYVASTPVSEHTHRYTSISRCSAESLKELSFRLFQFRYGYRDANMPLDSRLNTSIVKVDVRGKPESNDLLSCLSADLFLDGATAGGRQQVIYDPSDVVAFLLVRENMPSSTGAKVERHIFGYPDHIYLDQFLNENAELATEKRKLQHELHSNVQKLIAKREGLTKTNVSNPLHCFQALPSTWKWIGS